MTGSTTAAPAATAAGMEAGATTTATKAIATGRATEAGATTTVTEAATATGGATTAVAAAEPAPIAKVLERKEVIPDRRLQEAIDFLKIEEELMSLEVDLNNSSEKLAPPYVGCIRYSRIRSSISSWLIVILCPTLLHCLSVFEPFYLWIVGAFESLTSPDGT